MKILLIAPFGPGLLADSYARAFGRLGHDIIRFDSDQAYLNAARWAGNRVFRRLFRPVLWGRMNQSALQTLRTVRPDLAVVFKGAFLAPDTIRRIRRENIPIVNYYPDNPYCGVPLDPRKTSAQRRNLMESLREYERVFTWDAALVNRLRADGVSAAFLPFGADMDLFSPSAPNDCPACGRRHSIVFVGHHRARRQEHVDAVARHEVGLWGPHWNRAERRFQGRHVIHRERLFGDHCARVYSSAEVCLNIVDDLNMPGHNMRTFEIPACGALMLSRYTAEQAEFFPEGEAAWYYRQPAELDELLARLLSDGALRRRMRDNALRRARAHDYIHRAADMIRAVS